VRISGHTATLASIEAWEKLDNFKVQFICTIAAMPSNTHANAFNV